MIWGAFTTTTKCLLKQIPAHRKTTVDFVEVVYKGALRAYYDSHNDPSTLMLMENSSLVHQSNPLEWSREFLGMMKMVGLA